MANGGVPATNGAQGANGTAGTNNTQAGMQQLQQSEQSAFQEMLAIVQNQTQFNTEMNPVQTARNVAQGFAIHG